MAKNKSLVVIPCHRVVKSNGAIGEYAQGSDKKARLLIDEGVQIVKGKVKDMNKVIFRFSTM